MIIIMSVATQPPATTADTMPFTEATTAFLADIIAFFAGIFGLIIIRELPVVAIVSIIIAAICGFVAYNDTLSGVQWCAHAKECVGEEMYQLMMEIATAQKTRKRYAMP